MAKFIGKVVPTEAKYQVEFTEDELKAIVNVIGVTQHRNINQNLWEGSDNCSKISPSEFLDMYNVIAKAVGR